MFFIAATDPSISIPLWMQVGGGGIFALLVLRLVFDFLKDQRAKKENDSSGGCSIGDKKLHLSGKNPLAVLDEVHTILIGDDGVINTLQAQRERHKAIIETRDAQKENVLATKVGAREMMRIRCHLQNGHGPPMPGDNPDDDPNQKTDVFDAMVLKEMRKLDSESNQLC